MYILIFPFLGMFLALAASFLGRKKTILLIMLCILGAFLDACSLYKSTCVEGRVVEYNLAWFSLSELNVNFTILTDQLTVVMSIVITLITLLVMIYSKNYLENDPYIVKFFVYLSFFCFCMLVIVSAGNFIQFFIGWEGVGLSSYLLITFWAGRTKANQGALKAIIINRIGDVSLFCGVVLIGIYWKTVDFGVIFSSFSGEGNDNIKIIIALLLAIAACAKSAQLILHTWLPDAMEGPTPVSALLHSATMVTAGVFLIIRCSPIFVEVYSVSIMLTCLGLLTAFISGILGFNQYDLKRIIAFSTCSQLGFMFFSVGLGNYIFALFHLVTHAFFKCLLFLCSGAIIHAIGDNQDIRKFGNLFSYMPLTGVATLAGMLCLVGFPFTSGYYSKDLLMETAYNVPTVGSYIALMAMCTVGSTSIYSLRVFYYCFLNDQEKRTDKIDEAPFFMLFPMIVLSMLSVFSGHYLLEIFSGPAYETIQGSIRAGESSIIQENESIANWLAPYPQIPVICTGVGLLFSICYLKKIRDRLCESNDGYSFSILSSLKFGWDRVYNIIVGKLSFVMGYIHYKVFDKGFLEIWGPLGLKELISYFSRKLGSIDIGYIMFYLYIILNVLIIVFTGFSLNIE
jgi:NADH-quinone oxidoreductase subunit L